MSFDSGPFKFKDLLLSFKNEDTFKDLRLSFENEDTFEDLLLSFEDEKPLKTGFFPLKMKIH